MSRPVPRHAYDGQPYFCDTCGSPFAEFIACEDGDCQLETVAEARDRQRREADARLRNLASPSREGE